MAYCAAESARPSRRVLGSCRGTPQKMGSPVSESGPNAPDGCGTIPDTAESGRHRGYGIGVSMSQPPGQMFLENQPGSLVAAGTPLGSNRSTALSICSFSRRCQV